MPDWVRAGFDEYARRMPREAQLNTKEIKPTARGADASEAAIRRALALEHEHIAAALPAGCYKVVLDERRWRHASSSGGARDAMLHS